MRILWFNWLICLYLFISLVRNASFLIVKTVVSGKNSVMSKNHCARTYFWWVYACAPHLWFVHLPNWHFSLHLLPLQRPGMRAVYNFERLRFCSLPTSSQESVNYKSTFTFTFTLRTIYEINDTATWVLGVVFFNHVSSHLPPSPPHTPHPSLSLVVWGSLNSLSSHFLLIWSILPSMDWSIDPSIHQSFNRSIHWSIYQSIDPSINALKDQSINPSNHPSIDTLINSSIHQYYHPSIHQSIDPSISTSINQLIHRSIHQSIDS